MADATTTTKPRFSPTGCLRKLVLGFKVLLVLVVLVSSGVIGGLIVNQVNNNNFQGERERINQQESRIQNLVTTIEDLEKKNIDILSENQGLKDQLKTAEERQQEADKAKQIAYVTKELGKRLMSFQMDKPSMYFEYDKVFETAKVEAYPAEFTKDVIAEGIEISFSKSPIVIFIEPWKFSGRGLQEVEKFAVTTADNKVAQVVVLKDDKDKYTITGTILNGDKQDNTKLLITATVDKAQQTAVTEQVRDILRSLELNITQL